MHHSLQPESAMTHRPNTNDYLSIFLNDIPILDLRAPIEFAKGAFPNSVSEPLMNDEERRLVGTCYKQKGQDAAIKLGHQLVSGDTKAQRLAKWKAFAEAHPEGYIYCFRGGLRSRTTQSWIQEAGIHYPLIEGGYKAMRRFLIDQLDHLSSTTPLILLGGKTGTGKTRVLDSIPNSIDLEGIANHRGSSFGRRVSPQPSQINFENKLAIAFLKAHHQFGDRPLILEDEGRLIGRSSLPLKLKEAMAESKIIHLDVALEERVEITLEDYVIDLRTEHEAEYGEEKGFIAYQDHLLQSLGRIKKRLGGARTQALEKLMKEAFVEQRKNGNLDKHREWIKCLFIEYYDPMYRYQLDLKKDRIIFSGDQAAIIDWAKNH